MNGPTNGSNRPRRYAILGTGAIGGFYGARLQRAGAEVHFLLRSDYDWVRDRGLTVASCDGDFALPQVRAYRDAADLPPCDAAIVALKTTQNHRLPELLRSALAPDGVAVMLQNGLGAEEQAAAVVGDDRVMGGLCFVCANKTGPGRIEHLQYGKVLLAEYGTDYRPRGLTDRLQAIAADFRQAGIDVELGEDLLLARWQKLVWNVPFNGLSVVLDATTEAMMASPEIRALANDLMTEVAMGAGACGRAIADSFVQSMMDATERMMPYRTSMKIDYDEGRPLETEAIFGAPLRLARSQGVTLPRMAMLYRQLVFLDEANRAQRPVPAAVSRAVEQC